MSMNSEPIVVELDALQDGFSFEEAGTAPAAPTAPTADAAANAADIENRRELSDREYDALEEAVMQTARGRTFLREHARRNRAVATDVVMRAMDDYRGQLQRQELKQPTDILTGELQEMMDAIKHTRRDIAAIKPKEGANNRIMAATEDLDAIVTATERATNDILAAAERIQDTCGTLRETGSEDNLIDKLEEDITNIFLACSFQDITGQRTTKVVKALYYLEQRVGAMIEIWGSNTLRNGTEGEFASLQADDEHPDAALLNGPQLEGQGVDQADIDQLFLDDNEPVKAGSGAAMDSVDPTNGIEFNAAAAADTQHGDPHQSQDHSDASDQIDPNDFPDEADADTLDAIFNS